MQKFEINVTGSYSDAAMLRQMSEGVRIDQVPEGSLMNSKNEWNYFHVACAVVGRDSWYRNTVLAYMTLANRQTILVHLTWKFYWLMRLEERNIFREFQNFIFIFTFYISWKTYVECSQDVMSCSASSSSYSNTFLVSAFTISQNYYSDLLGIIIFCIALIIIYYFSIC